MVLSHVTTDIVKTKICIRNEFNSRRDISVIRTGEGLGRAKVLLCPGEQIGTDDIKIAGDNPTVPPRGSGNALSCFKLQPL